MKKLKLKALELGAREVLTREQLKNVLGGFDDGSGSGSGSGSGRDNCSTLCVAGGKSYVCQTSVSGTSPRCVCPAEWPTQDCPK